MFLSQGIDIVENKRIEILISKYGDVLKKILSKDEIIDIDKMFHKKIQKISRFAAKEATVKAIGTGFRMGLKLLILKLLTINLVNQSFC